MSRTPVTDGSLLDLADRLWNAAYALDNLRGDTAASEWTARQVHSLMRGGRADDADVVSELAGALEGRLASERHEQGTTKGLGRQPEGGD